MSILMHKDTPVADVKIIKGRVVGFNQIYREDLLPIGLHIKYSFQTANFLKAWYDSRSIPNGRQGIENITKVTGQTPEDGFLKAMGVSLTDMYWIKEKGSQLTWKDVNFHDNGFEPVFAKVLAGADYKWEPSPDYTTDGMLEKFWTVSGGIPYLSKMSDDRAEIANEIIVSNFAISLGLNAVNYTYGEISGIKVCTCPSFVTDANTDYSSALQISHETNLRGQSLVQYFDETLGFKKALDEVRFLDVLFHQEDRHEKNIGMLATNNTLTLAPIFDNGRCLGVSRSELASPLADNLKFFNKPLTAVAEDIDVIPEFSEGYLRDLVKDAYEMYGVSEQRYEWAIEELNKGIEILNDARDKGFSR